MKTANHPKLRTLRLKPEDAKLINAFLQANPVFESFSALTRTALLTFIQSKGFLPLTPIRLEQMTEKPSFLWDYDLTKIELKLLLQSGPLNERRAFMAKILCHCPFSEIWDYLTMQCISEQLAHLRMPKKIKQHWETALHVWQES